MSMANLVGGQPASFFSTLGSYKTSRRLSRKGANNKSMGLRQSAWALFRICSVTTGTWTIGSAPVFAEVPMRKQEPGRAGATAVSPVAETLSHGKKVFKEYSVIGIPGDGRCLFRAVAHGAQVRKGNGAPNEAEQREYADTLREKVVDELVKRREETEWFIEGDFDAYTRRMRQPHVWGGEPELLMASHVLRMPISVYMFEQRSGGIISIAEYGEEYRKKNETPITVLYHGSGHYDALQFPGQQY